MTTEAKRRGGYRYTLSLLTIIYVFNFVDRQIVNIVAEPIKAEFGLADWQLGAMTGLSFAILYTVCGFPVARWAERGDRPRIIAAAVLIWSLFTALCGAAQSFTLFLLARVGVGIGEAGGTPPAHSLIAEIVPAARRASAIAIYSIGAPVGQMFGMAMGGFVAAQWGWRSVFYIAAVPGLLLGGLALFTVPEPRRTEAPAERAEAPVPFGPAIAALLSNRSFVLLAAGGSVSSFASFGMNAFYASFFLRNHGAELARVAAAAGLAPLGLLGLALGATGGAAGLIGSVAGGRIADAWRARNGAAYALFPALCLAAMAPLLVAAMLAPGFWPAITLVAIASLPGFAFTGVLFAAALGLVPARSRATASALLLFLVNVAGLGLGPLCVGATSDALAPLYGSAGGLRLALCGAAAVFWAAGALFFAARGTIAADTIS